MEPAGRDETEKRRAEVARRPERANAELTAAAAREARRVAVERSRHAPVRFAPAAPAVGSSDSSWPFLWARWLTSFP